MSLKYGAMTLTVELVTPAIAKRWLEQTNKRNRSIRTRVVIQYADDMANDAWHRKPVAVCFDTEGLLGNGQHTLSAIVKSNVPQELLVARNVPREAISAMDVGVKRTIADIAHFVGSDFGSREAAIAKAIVFGVAKPAPKSFATLFDAYTAHQQPIDWLCAVSPKASGFSAPVLAVIARAWYSRDRARLAEFIEVLRTGIVNSPDDSSAIRLRDYCRSLKSAGGSTAAVECYQRAESALDHFLRRRPMSKLYGTERELFPLPDTLK